MYSSNAIMNESFFRKLSEDELINIASGAQTALENYLMKKFEIQPYIFPELDILLESIGCLLNKKRNKMTSEEKNREPQDSKGSLDNQTNIYIKADNDLHLIEYEPKKTLFLVTSEKNLKSVNAISEKRVNLRSDSMRKRIKTAVNNYIFRKLNFLIRNEKSQIYFLKLPIYFSDNLNLHINKEIIFMTIRDIFSKIPPICSETDKKRVMHNISIMNDVKVSQVDAILSKTWKEMFEEFVKSTDLVRCLDHIFKSDGPLYHSYFKKQLEQFLQHFIGYPKASLN